MPISDQMFRYSLLAITVINLAVNGFLWIVSKTLVSKDDHGALAIRVVRLEVQTSKAPDWGAINLLKDRVQELSGSVRELSAKIQGMKALMERSEKTLDLVEQQLLARDRE